MPTKKLWRLVTNAFAVEDGLGHGKRLRAKGKPHVGDAVDIHFNCSRKLVSSDGKTLTWGRLSGEIVKVLSDDIIRVELVGATATFPRIFPDFWRATLKRNPEWMHPWVVTKLEPAQRLRAKIYGAEGRRAFRRAVRRYRAELDARKASRKR